MSRIGKKPIEIPKECTVVIDGRNVSVKGPNGELKWKVPLGINLELKDNILTVNRENEIKETVAFHGLSRAYINNMVIGVTKGFEKRLMLVWKGGKMDVVNNAFTMNVNFIKKEYKPPKGINLVKEKGEVILVSGADKQQVGEVAAKIRSFLPPEPYHLKGIRYANEKIKQKAIKKGA